MAKPYTSPVQNDLVRLRLATRADLPMTLAWRNQDQIRRWFLSSDRITHEQHAAWFERYLDRDNDFVFIIEDAHESWKPVGQVSLYDIQFDNKTAEFGRLMIGEMGSRGKGLAKAATLLVLKLGFEQLMLEEIFLEVFFDNTPARSLYESVGFSPSGEKENLLLMRLSKNSFGNGGQVGR